MRFFFTLPPKAFEVKFRPTLNKRKDASARMHLMQHSSGTGSWVVFLMMEDVGKSSGSCWEL